MNSRDKPEDREAQWTAYALDQLKGEEKDAVQRELHDDAEARQFVEQIRALAGHVQAARRREPLPAASSELRQRIVEEIQEKEVVMSEANRPRPSQPTPPRRRRWSPVLTAACSFLAGGIVIALILPAIEPPRSSGPTPEALARLTGTASQTIEKPESGPSQEKIDKLVAAVAQRVPPGSARNVDISQYPPPNPTADSNPMVAPPVGNQSTGTTPGKPMGTATNPYPRMVPPLTGNAPGMGPYDGTSKVPVAVYPDESPQTGRFMIGVGVNSDAGLHSSIVTDKRFQSKPSKTNATGGKTSLGYNASAPAQPQPARPAYSPYMRLGSPTATPAGTITSSPHGARQTTANPVYRVGDSGVPVASPSTVDTSTERSVTVGVNAPGVFSADLGTYRMRITGFTSSVGPNTEQYDPIVENRFLRPLEAPLSTFSIDVDTASYANVRRFLSGNQLPPPSAVRIEEMINYFSYDYPRPEGDEPFSVNFELAACPWNNDHQLLRVGLAGREIERDKRGASNLVFLLDVSGSMMDQNKLPLVKQAMRLLVQRLTEDDRVAIVTYASGTAVRLESTNGQNKKAILDVIEGLSAGGSTNGSGGIQLAYQQAVKNFLPEGNNRVILATDGDLNVGITQDDQLVKLIEEKAKSGVFLSVLGFGMGNLKDSKLEKLADKGNGNYAYIDNLREARKVLVDEMAGSLVTIAKDVKIQIEFNPARVAAYRLIGYENRKLRARDFDDDTKDAGEIGAGHTVTALYELVPAGSEDDKAAAIPGQPELKYQKVVRPTTALTDAADSNELATIRLRYKKPDGRKSRLIERTVTGQGVSFSGATPDFQFAAAVAAFGMLLRDSKYAGNATLAAVEEYATPGLNNDPSGYRAEFVDLVRKSRQLKPARPVGQAVPDSKK